MAEIAKMIVVLSLICGIAGFSLAYLKVTLTPLIKVQEMTFVQKPSIDSIFGAIENDPLTDSKEFTLPDGNNVTIFPIKRDGKLYGVAIEARGGGGFNGDMGVMVGINTQSSKLIGIGTTTHSETPGLGTKTGEPKFTNQFKDKSLNPVLGEGISAVAGATMSSTAVVNGVNAATAIYEQLKGEIASAWQ